MLVSKFCPRPSLFGLILTLTLTYPLHMSASVKIPN